MNQDMKKGEKVQRITTGFADIYKGSVYTLSRDFEHRRDDKVYIKEYRNPLAISGFKRYKEGGKLAVSKDTSTKRYSFSVAYEAQVDYSLINCTVDQPMLIIDGLDDTVVGLHTSIFDKAVALSRTHELEALIPGYPKTLDGITYTFSYSNNIKDLIDLVKSIRQAKGTRREVTVKYVEV